MARPDAAAAARTAHQRSVLDAWGEGLDADDLGLATPLGPVGTLIAAAESGSEFSLVLALIALADAFPDRPPSIDRGCIAGAVRGSLGDLAAAHPGHLVEVRVPPWGAVQIGLAGHDQIHRRGTPPNVVETDPLTWLRLAGGLLSWRDAVASHAVSASGAHAQLDDLLPLP